MSDDLEASVADRRELENRLRAMGLPLVVAGRVRSRSLLRRTAVVTIMLGQYLLASQIAMNEIEASGLDDADVPLEVTASLYVSAALTLAIPLTAWLTLLLVRRLGSRGGGIVGAGGAALLVFGQAVAAPRLAMTPIIVGLGLLAVILVATYVGFGTLVGWAMRRVVGESWVIGPMTARVLPLLALATLFFFYNAEIWQIAVKLDARRTVAAVVVFAVLCSTLAVVTIRDALRPVWKEREDERRPSLSWWEKLNVLLVPSLITLIQAMILAALIFGFFVFFGWLSIPPATAEQWATGASARMDGLFGRLPVSATLAKVSLMLAAFSALNFVAAVGTDARHREEFFEPLLEEVAQGLELRDEYRALPSR